jgi:peptidoglycan/LPS O-acetylase OafA/YrhL
MALLAMKIAGKILKIPPAKGRFASIDGLRGYLAFFVFLHHSCVWYFFTHGYGWHPPPSNLYNQFGPTSVIVFFMITSFLFFSKLLKARSGNINWLQLYISRFLRILPLYWCSIFIMVLAVGFLTHFTLYQPVGEILWGITQWLFFIKVDLNGLSPTAIITAGVVWSLCFEWFFYFTLPFMGLLLKIRLSLSALLFTVVGLSLSLLLIIKYHSEIAIPWLSPFLGGVPAAILAKNGKVRELASSRMASFCIVLLLILVAAGFPSALEPVPLLLLAAAFTGIACGNDLFGILTYPISRTLGQISYGIYLLHAIVLFVTFHDIVGFNKAEHLSPLEHWSIIALCGIIVVFVCSLTYWLIERPALNVVPAVTERIRLLLGRKK